VIFVTIGSLFPFDRLVKVADELAVQMPDESFFAQIGEGGHRPVNIPYAEMLTRGEFMAKVREADLIVAHAGMGSVITAMESNTPIILLPRILEWGEHTTDHQIATAKWLEGRPGIHVCWEDKDLRATIEAVRAGARMGQTMQRTAPEPFLNRIRDFIASA
jgi:UDP-N-acetylglucosamine transferase subunit ALG13